MWSQFGGTFWVSATNSHHRIVGTRLFLGWKVWNNFGFAWEVPRTKPTRLGGLFHDPEGFGGGVHKVNNLTGFWRKIRETTVVSELVSEIQLSTKKHHIHIQHGETPCCLWACSCPRSKKPCRQKNIQWWGKGRRMEREWTMPKTCAKWKNHQQLTPADCFAAVRCVFFVAKARFLVPEDVCVYVRLYRTGTCATPRL